MEIIANAARWMFDAIFPKFCIRCGLEGVWVCDSCSEKFQKWNGQGCSVCKKKSIHLLCGDCAKDAPVSFLFSAYSYADPYIKKTVHALKYEYISEIGRFMGMLLAEKYRDFGHGYASDAHVVPIPIHRKRFRDRGFNQSELIARAFAETANIMYVPNAIERVIDTQSQVNLSGSERIQNVSGAFAVRNMRSIYGETVYLIDDVCTTGATLLETARTLRAAGVKDIIGVTFAREE